MNDKKDMDLVVKALLIDYISNTNSLNGYTIFIVWKSKVLKNWKYLIGTDIPDNKYYEITYNGYRKEFYIDEYLKINNTVIDWSEQNEAIK